MQNLGYTLATNATGAAALAAVTVVGGRYSLALSATTFPSTCALQVLGPDGSTWISLNASAYSANQVTAYDIPSGQVRMNLSGGTAAALYACLTRVPY